MSRLAQLASAWMSAKAAEASAIAARREIEDEMLEAAKLITMEEGTTSLEIPGFKAKVTARFNRKVDGDKLMTIAMEHDVSYEVLQTLFRWKPELAMKEWKAADPAITGVLVDAITTTAGRPTFSIEADESN